MIWAGHGVYEIERFDRRSEELAHRFESTQDVIFLGRDINSRLRLRVP